jgi:hypothetical protein
MHNMVVAYDTNYIPDRVAEISTILARGVEHLRANDK